MTPEDKSMAEAALLLEEKIDQRVAEAVARLFTSFSMHAHYKERQAIMAAFMTELLGSNYFREQMIKHICERLMNRTIY